MMLPVKWMVFADMSGKTVSSESYLQCDQVNWIWK